MISNAGDYDYDIPVVGPFDGDHASAKVSISGDEPTISMTMDCTKR